MKTVMNSAHSMLLNLSKRRLISNTLVLMIWFGISSTALSQNQSTRVETDKGMRMVVASQDANIRQAILTTSQYPDILSQIAQLKERTKASFHALIGSFNQQKQGWFYELSRYPDLLHSLATQPTGLKRSAIEGMLPNQESHLKTAAWKLYHNHHEDLIETDRLEAQANQNFNDLVANTPVDVREQFRLLSQHPDVLETLTDNLALTTNLGQLYASDKAGLTQQLAEQHDSLVLQNQQVIQSYKQQMDSNPQAVSELNQAAKDFAQANGYILPNGQYASTNNNYWANPYSFWFGYPYWYGSPLWYPGAYWSNFGMYYGLGGLGFYGFPSLGFSNWFFNGGYYTNYPILYRQFGRYYRTNLWTNRPYVPASHAFMSVANQHFNPANRLPNSTFNRPSFSGRSFSPNNSFRSYNTAPSGFGSRSSFGGGRSFSGGFGGRRR